MYRTIQHQMSIDDYLPPYEGELVQENRWVRLAQAIDWDAIEQEYSGHFAAGGKVAIPARMAFGVLVIRAACRTTDSETVEIVRESPYLQYFLGFDSFTYDVPFSSRSMERFRTRISPARVREAVALLALKPTKAVKNEKGPHGSGQLLRTVRPCYALQPQPLQQIGELWKLLLMLFWMH